MTQNLTVTEVAIILAVPTQTPTLINVAEGGAGGSGGEGGEKLAAGFNPASRFDWR
jgi:hypothetical protein